MGFTGEPVHPDLTALPHTAPFLVKPPLTEQVRHDRHPVEPGGAQIASLLIDMRGEGSAQEMQAVQAGIEAGLFQPRLKQPPELTFAEMGMRLPWPLNCEQPSV